MKNEIFEGGFFVAWKLLGGLYLLSSVLETQLLSMGFNIYFLYIGLLGQIVATLVELQQTTSKNMVIRVSWPGVLSSLLQLVIAPILSLLLTSMFFVAVSPASGILAFGIGAFWEMGWAFIKKKTRENFKNDELPKTSAEDRPSNGPR